MLHLKWKKELIWTLRLLYCRALNPGQPLLLPEKEKFSHGQCLTRFLEVFGDIKMML